MAVKPASVPSPVVVTGTGARFAQQVTAGGHTFAADEPVAAGGTDTGPTPYDLLAAALGTCTSMTLGVYARRKAYPLEDIIVRVQHSKVHATDCAQCDTKEGRIDRLDVEVSMTGPLSEEQREDLLRIARKCPVHRTLSSEMEIRVVG